MVLGTNSNSLCVQHFWFLVIDTECVSWAVLTESVNIIYFTCLIWTVKLPWRDECSRDCFSVSSYDIHEQSKPRWLTSPARLYFIPYRFMPVSTSVHFEVQRRQRTVTNRIIYFKYVGFSARIQHSYVFGIIYNKFVDALSVEDKYWLLKRPGLRTVTNQNNAFLDSRIRLIIPNPSLNMTANRLRYSLILIAHIRKRPVLMFLSHILLGIAIKFFQEVFVPNLVYPYRLHCPAHCCIRILLTTGDVCKWRSSSLRDNLNCLLTPSALKICSWLRYIRF